MGMCRVYDRIYRIGKITQGAIAAYRRIAMTFSVAAYYLVNSVNPVTSSGFVRASDYKYPNAFAARHS
jgi:hypothetical protein